MKIKILCLGIVISLFAAQGATASEADATIQELPSYSDIQACSSTDSIAEFDPIASEYCLGEAPFYWYESNPKWSGFVVGGQSDIYTEVKARITTPADRSYSCGYGHWGAWVGLGGYHTTNTIQAGITTSPYVAGEYVFFLEYLNYSNPNGPIYVKSQSFQPGTELLISVSYNKVTHKAMFYVMNYSTGISYTRNTNGDVSNYYDGSSAEWVNEKNGSEIYNFGTFHWDDARVRLVDGSWSDFGAEPGHGLRITNDYGDVIATPQYYPTSATSFVDKFYRCN